MVGFFLHSIGKIDTTGLELVCVWHGISGMIGISLKWLVNQVLSSFN